ncbi:hypothetical protein ACCS79_03615 [Rhizobium johnstonii]|uniref:hypothetical protein n=1 Tax=Rhizobium johnstonii TaxID=3019933 RepID=UPI003F9B6DF1
MRNLRPLRPRADIHGLAFYAAVYPFIRQLEEIKRDPEADQAVGGQWINILAERIGVDGQPAVGPAVGIHGSSFQLRKGLTASQLVAVLQEPSMQTALQDVHELEYRGDLHFANTGEELVVDVEHVGSRSVLMLMHRLA